MSSEYVYHMHIDLKHAHIREGDGARGRASSFR